MYKTYATCEPLFNMDNSVLKKNQLSLDERITGARVTRTLIKLKITYKYSFANWFNQISERRDCVRKT